MNGQNQRQIKNRLSEAVAASGTRTVEHKLMLRGAKGVKSGLLMAANVAYGSRSYGDGGKGLAPLSLCETDGGAPMTQVDDLSRSLITFEQNSTMVVVLEMSQSSWLAAGVVPGIERRPLKKLDPDPMALLRLVEGRAGPVV